MSAFTVEYLAGLCDAVFFLSLCGAILFSVLGFAESFIHNFEASSAWELGERIPPRNNCMRWTFIGLAVFCLLLVIFVPSGRTIQLLSPDDPPQSAVMQEQQAVQESLND